MKQLAHLKRIDPRDVWEDENEFNSWLAENPKILGEVLGIEFGRFDRESKIGQFSADLVGTDLTTNRNVVIECQLTPSDHDHLGKVLTYAAGKGADIIIWISSKFSEPHRSTLDWLNEKTDENTWFFGLEIEVLQIEDSKPAPYFKIVSKPNEWQKEQKRVVEGVTERGRKYQEFFSSLLDKIKKEIPDFTTASKVYPQNWFAVGAGRSGFGYAFVFTRDQKYRIELWIDTGDREINKKAFNMLFNEKEQIEREIGSELSWERLEDKRMCRIALYREGHIEMKPEELKELQSWSVEFAKKFKQTFTPRIKMLQLE